MTGQPSLSFTTLKTHSALIAVSSIYGFFYVVVKLLLGHLQDHELILIRLLGTAVVVMAIEWAAFKTRFDHWKDWVKMAGLGMLGVYCVQTLLVCGLHLTTSFHASLLMVTTPIITLLFSLLQGRESFDWRKALGILVAFVGVGFLLSDNKPDTPLPPTYLWGDGLVFLNACLFSLFLLGNQTLLKKYPSFSVMAYQYGISALTALFVLFVSGLLHQSPVSFDWLYALSHSDWLLVLYVIFFASIATYTLNNYALKRTAPSTVAVYIFIQPVISAFLGNRLLGETFTHEMALSGVLIFAGVLMATMMVQKRETETLFQE